MKQVYAKKTEALVSDRHQNCKKNKTIVCVILRKRLIY